MKKLLLVLIVAFAFCGSSIAQTPWDGMNTNAYEMHAASIAYVAINGEIITLDYNGFENLEVAYFVEETFRGSTFMVDDGDPNPTAQCEIFYPLSNGTEKVVSFMMYDHNTGTLYENCTPSQTILTGVEHYEIWDEDWDNALVLNFIGEEPAPITLDIPANMWQLIASPVGTVESVNVTNLRNTGYDFYYFDQAQQLEWINDRPEGFDSEAPEYAISEMVAGKGYLYAHSDEETRTLTFPGTANTDPVTVTLHKTAATAGLDFPDWNLVGNPYNVQAYIDRPFYRMEGGAFLSEASTGAINRMEGVFVVASEEGEQMAFSTETKANVGNLALNLRKDSKTIDRAIVSFGEGDMLPKAQFIGEATRVYIPVEGTDYAVVTSEGMGEMPVSFKAESNGTYSLNLSSQNVDFAYLHLIDNLTGADQDLLANPSYSFSANTTDYASRFRLVFATGNDEDSFAFFSNGSLFVNNEGSAVLQVVDVTGRILKSESINGCASVNFDAAPGVYMVRLVNGDNMKVQKVVK